MKIVRVILTLIIFYKIMEAVENVSVLKELISLGLEYLQIPLAPETFFLIIFGLMTIAFIFSDYSLQSLSLTYFFMTTFIWLLNSPVMKELFPKFSGIILGMIPLHYTSEDEFITVVLLSLAFISDTWGKYERINLNWKDFTLGFGYSLVVVGASGLLFYFLKDMALNFEINIPIALLLITLSLSFYILSQEKTNNVITVVRVKVPLKTEFRVEGNKIRIIPISGPEEIKIKEFQGEYKVYLNNFPLKKILESQNNGTRIIVYSNEKVQEV
ncbi:MULTISPECIES: hypothetical protein [Pyrococcus]|nr:MULTISPECIES: hypothetical protein [Pyrococcus]